MRDIKYEVPYTLMLLSRYISNFTEFSEINRSTPEIKGKGLFITCLSLIDEAPSFLCLGEFLTDQIDSYTCL